MDAELRQAATTKLREIESKHGVRVLYACEAGSRAWGFDSADSDQDVRFIYRRPAIEYLSPHVEDRRDVIDGQIVGDMDAVGWDVRKAFKLLAKCNAALIEWLASPIVYAGDDAPVVVEMRRLRALYHSTPAIAWHYVKFAEGNFREYLQGDRVHLKKYLYVTRPLLAVRWTYLFPSEPPPVRMDALLDAVSRHENGGEWIAGALPAIRDLVARKKAGDELADGPRIPVLSDFLRDGLAWAKAVAGKMSGEPRPLNRFVEMDAVFQQFLIGALIEDGAIKGVGLDCSLNPAQPEPSPPPTQTHSPR